MIYLIRSTCSKKERNLFQKRSEYLYSRAVHRTRNEISKLAFDVLKREKGFEMGEREREMGLALKGNGSFDFNQINVKTGLIKKNHTAKNGRISG